MRAIQFSAFGDADVLRLVDDAPVPDVGRGEVRVRLHAAGVNPAETYIRSGTYAFYRPALPHTPGFDGAGIVDAVGPGVTDVEPGARVFVGSILASRKTGTYAEYTVCDAAAVHPLPDHLSFAQGAAIGVPGATAYRALFQRGGLRPGQTVLVHGASGGVGVLAVQWARAHGATVIGTAGTPEGRQTVAGAGAHAVLDHSVPDHLHEIAHLTSDRGGQGVDLVIEMLADVNLVADLDHLARYGRVVVVGSRGSLEFTPRLTMAAEADVRGMALWNARPEEWGESLRAVAAALESGVLRPVVGRELPLEQAAQAHRMVLERGAHGKLVLTIA
jgi:NADPH2:quinone reductase